MHAQPPLTMRPWFIATVLLAAFLAPMLNQPVAFEDSTPLAKSSPLQASLSSTSGWTSGGEDLTITGTGFRDMADRNVSYDGINHQWAASNLDLSSQAGRWNAIGVDSNGHLHVVQINGRNYEIMHSVNDGTGWNTAESTIVGTPIVGTFTWSLMPMTTSRGLHDLHGWDETLVS